MTWRTWVRYNDGRTTTNERDESAIRSALHLVHDSAAWEILVETPTLIIARLRNSERHLWIAWRKR